VISQPKRDFAQDGNPLLFSLLDAMDGVGADADVTFALTTNRANILEEAAASDPRLRGRKIR
jgi:ATP-dependent 26S proteasome regulatory subunit